VVERYFGYDPDTAIFKVRQLAEHPYKTIAAYHALYLGDAIRRIG
jgi:type I restriction enzyme R subunit